MQLRSLCILFTFLIAVAFIVPPQAVVAKSTTDSTTTDTKKKDTKEKKTKKADKSKKKAAKKQQNTKSAKGKININTATAKELALIPGVGPVTAKNIISYRKKHGKFKSSKDLLNVKGIGEKTLKKMKSKLKL